MKICVVFLVAFMIGESFSVFANVSIGIKISFPNNFNRNHFLFHCLIKKGGAVIQYNYIGGEQVAGANKSMDNHSDLLRSAVLSKTHEFLRALTSGGNSFYGVSIGNENVKLWTFGFFLLIGSDVLSLLGFIVKVSNNFHIEGGQLKPKQNREAKQKSVEEKGVLVDQTANMI